MNKRKPVLMLLLPFLVFYAVFVILPIVGVFLKSFVTSHTLELELLRPSKFATVKWTLENYMVLFKNEYYITATLNTLYISVGAVIISLIVGTPIAYLITRHYMKGKRLVEWILAIPIYLSGVVTCYSLLLFFSRNGPVNFIAMKVTGESVRVNGTILAIILGTSYIVLPIYIRVARSGFQMIKSSVLEVSLTLGANEFYTFRKIVLPLVLPAIAAGAILVFTYSMSLVVVILILGSGGATFTILPLEILSTANGLDQNIPLATAMAIILFVIAIIGQAITERLLQTTET